MQEQQKGQQVSEIILKGRVVERRRERQKTDYFQSTKYYLIIALEGGSMIPVPMQFEIQLHCYKMGQEVELKFLLASHSITTALSPISIKGYVEQLGEIPGHWDDEGWIPPQQIAHIVLPGGTRVEFAIPAEYEKGVYEGDQVELMASLITEPDLSALWTEDT